MLFLAGAGLLAGQMLFRWRINRSVATGIAVLLALAGIYLGSLPWGQNIVAFINRMAGDPETGTFLTRPLG